MLLHSIAIGEGAQAVIWDVKFPPPSDISGLRPGDIELKPGDTVGKYVIIRVLDPGRKAAIYQAQHTVTGRKAVIKTLTPEMYRDQNTVKRFFKEAKATSVIEHPGIVEIYEVDFQGNGILYIAMEYLEGETLRDRLDQVERLPILEATEILRQTCSALHAAHIRGIVHRDLTPDNIFLVPYQEVPDPEVRERVKIINFAVARFKDHEAYRQTGPGMVLGSPLYMSPEQCRNPRNVDARTDLYSLGCVLFEMLCGRPPFVRDSTRATKTAHIEEERPRPTDHAPELPRSLEDFILRLLARKPDERFASAKELFDAIPDQWTDTSLVPERSDRVDGTPVPGIDTSEQPALPQPPVEPLLPSPPVTDPSPTRSQRWMPVAGVGLALLGLAGWAISTVANPPGDNDRIEPLIETPRPASGWMKAQAAPEPLAIQLDAHDQISGLEFVGWSQDSQRFAVEVTYRQDVSRIDVRPAERRNLAQMARVHDALTGLAVASFRLGALSPHASPAVRAAWQESRSEDEWARYLREETFVAAEPRPAHGLRIAKDSRLPYLSRYRVYDHGSYISTRWSHFTRTSETEQDVRLLDQRVRYSRRSPGLELFLPGEGKTQWRVFRTRMTSYFSQAFELPETPDGSPASADHSITPYWSPDGHRFVLVQMNWLHHDGQVIERDGGYYVRTTGPQIQLIDAGIGEQRAREIARRLEKAGMPVTMLTTAEQTSNVTKIYHRESPDTARIIAGILGQELPVEELTRRGWVHVIIHLGVPDSH